MNVVVLRGTLSRSPQERVLPSGSVVVQLDLATPVEPGVATVPVAWRDPPTSLSLRAGEDVWVVGTVQRRFFRAGGTTQSRTEVVARSVIRATNRRGVARLLAEATGAFEAG